MRILMCGTGGAGKKNFEQTVRNSVDLEQYAGTLTFTQRQLLEARHGRFARVSSIPGMSYPDGGGLDAGERARRGRCRWRLHRVLNTA